MQIFWHLLPHFGGMSVGFPCRARRGPSALQGGRGVGVWVVVVVVVCGCVGVGGWVWVCEWCGGGGGGGGARMLLAAQQGICAILEPAPPSRSALSRPPATTARPWEL